METRWDCGEAVRVVRNVRNDGTFPGQETGALLVRRGSLGTIVDVGTFLLDQIIYAVHFLDIDRIVGCREEELIGAGDPWLPAVFEARQKVMVNRILSIGGDVCVPAGGRGEILRVVCDGEAPVYHVHFDCLPGRMFAVPEKALDPVMEMSYA